MLSRDIPTDTLISRQTETHLFTRVPHVQTVNTSPLTQLERSQSSPLTEIVLRRPSSVLILLLRPRRIIKLSDYL